MKKILLTGFKPFLGQSVNPSGQLLESLKTETGIETLLLPVEYDAAFETLKAHLEKGTYDGVLMLGQAAQTSNIRIERIALNLEDADSADESGTIRLNKKIEQNADLALMTSLPIRTWVNYLKKGGHAIELSNSAGTYVCNSTYYKTLSWSQKNPWHSNWQLFIHVPTLPEQLPDKSDATSSMPLAQMEKTLRALLDLIQAL